MVNPRRLVAAASAGALFALLPAAPAAAAPVRGTISLDQPSPHRGDTVTFTTTTTGNPEYPWIEVRCTQGSSLVYMDGARYFFSTPASYTFTLDSQNWQSSPGAADCTATFYAQQTAASNKKALASTSFTVLA